MLDEIFFAQDCLYNGNGENVINIKSLKNS